MGSRSHKEKKVHQPPPPPKTSKTFRVVMAGSPTGGKTSLIMRFVDDKFTDSFATLSKNPAEKSLTVKNVDVALKIGDTQGEDRMMTMTDSYYKNAAGVVLVFDLSSKDSFNEVSKHMNAMERYAENAAIIIAANKSDLKREVSAEDIQRLCDTKSVEYLECSALNGRGRPEGL